MDKADLRRALAAKRAQAFADQPLASRALITHCPIKSPLDVIIAGYLPFKTEIDPLPLMLALKGLSGRRAQLALPRTPAKGITGPLSFHLCDPWNADHLEKSEWGVMQPHLEQPVVRPDIILVPLLGFDAACNRIGQGQGHYDRTLEALRGGASFTAIGLAFEAQKVAALPVEPHDQCLDWIITEKQAYQRP